jgi:dTDP-4-amino-4,6-dideoxygalactose transaminase
MIPLHIPPLKLKDAITLPTEDYVSKLKEYFSKNFKKDSVVFTSDGRNAIYLALKTIGLKRNDEILIPAYVCDAVREAINPICRPVYVDIDKGTFNIDVKKIESNITKNTKAILVAHLYGNPCDMKEIADIAGDNNLMLIEDVAQSLNGKYNGEKLGSFGDFAMFSFRFTKDITSFRGGALLANEKINMNLKSDSSFKAFFRLIITLAAMKQIKMTPATIYAPLKKHILFPFFKESASKFNVNDRALSNYQCYLLYQQLKKMDSIIERRRANAKYYSKELKDVVVVPKETKIGKHTYYRYTIQSDKRDELFNFLLKRGIEADKMYDYCLAPLPNSIIASRNNLNIPVHHELTKENSKKIVEAIHEFKKVE